VAVGVEGGPVILIDAPPELRLAVVECGVRRVDAILFTHAHADHIMGLDDVRRFNDIARATLTCYGGGKTLAILRRIFGYAEVPYRRTPTDRPSLRFERIDGPREICGQLVVPIELLHGSQPVLGFRIGGFAYCTDCSAIPAKSEALLGGLELLVIDGLRHRPHPTHFNIAGALEEIARLKPARALLTHMTHDVPHERTNRLLPPGVRLAYDGLRFSLGS
jgi:phosphoribosyl 1,2-cyclic phosphate phosphodiesterase